MAALFAFLHHLAAFVIFAALVLELVLIKGELSLRSARTLQLADLAYGVAAGSLLVVGVLRVMYFEKGADYYLHNVSFHIKMAAFLTVGLLSIIPTMEFLSWSKSLKRAQLPQPGEKRIGLIRKIIYIELAGMVIILLAAALMARGIGLTR